VAARLDVGLELGAAIGAGLLLLLVGVEGGGVGGDVDGVGPVEIGGAQRYRRRVPYADVEEGGGGEYAILRGRVCDRVPASRVLALASKPPWDTPAAPTRLHACSTGYAPDHLADPNAARLVQQQHPSGAFLRVFQLLPRLCCAHKVRGRRSCATLVRGLREVICARREQHLADLIR
jgi:hypothetical protein